MGVVYRAEHARLGRKVALKLIAPEIAEDAVSRERFLTEARLAASIDHPNVIPIYDAGEANGLLYLAMRYVEGEDLGTLLRKDGPFELRRALEVVSSVANALAAAHERGLVHRDVKPGNILVARDGFVYLTDFGLTKRAELPGGPTATGQLLGTPEYMAPEQIEGRPIDGRADIYSLACVAAELLTGAPPFEREQDVALIFAHLSESPPLLSERRPDLAALDEPIARALAKRPDERQPSITAFLHELVSAAGGEAPAPASRRRKRKLVTVVSVDLGGSDHVDPEALEQLFPRFAQLAGTTLADEGGRVDSTASDTVTAIFGVPQAREDDALRAVRAASSAVAALAELTRALEQRWGAAIAARAGIETGEVLVDERVGTGPLPSACFRAALRLREAAAPGEVVLGETTHRVVREWIEADEHASGGWRVTAVLERPRAASRPETQLIGRESERALVENAFERAARDRSCQLVTLLGEAGIGKSRLLEDVTTGLEERATVLSGRCLSYGDGVSFFPLAAIVRGAAGVPETEPASEVERGLASVLSGDDDGSLIAARVTQLVGIAEGTLRTEEAAWAVRRLLEALARDRPVVVVLEDCHWADEVLLELLEHVADSSRGASILLICTARPELFDVRPGWGGGKVNAATVLLEPLPEEASRRLITDLLGGAEVPEEVASRVAAAAGGNPLFAEEMVEVLIDDQVLVRDNGRWVATVELDTIPVPASIQALLAARLDRLTDGEKIILERASVEGQVFHRGGVVYLSSGRASGLGQSLGVLVRRELIRPDRATFAGEDAFRFRHILFREACYGALPKNERAELHELFADWLESLLGSRISEFEEIVAFHLDQALRYRDELGLPTEDAPELAERTGSRLAAAGERCLARGDVSGAIALLGRAQEVTTDPPRRIELQLDLADALWTMGDLDRTREILETAARIAVEVGDDRLAARAELQRLILESDTDPSFDLTELTNAIERAETTFERAGDELGLALAARAAGEVQATLCRWADAAAALERALEHAQRAGAVREAMPIVSFIATCVYWGPTPVSEGLETCADLLRRAEGHRVAEANVITYLAGLRGLVGDFEESRALVAQARHVFEDLDYAAGLAAATPVFGTVELAAGDPAAAEREFRSGLEILEAAGETGILSTLAAFLAEALHRQGRDDEALEVTRLSEASAASDDVASQIAWRSTRARIATAQGAPVEGRRLAEEAIERAECTDFVGMHADALVALSVSLGALGADDEAVRALGQALELFERKGDVVSVARVRGALGVGSRHST